VRVPGDARVRRRHGIRSVLRRPRRLLIPPRSAAADDAAADTRPPPPPSSGHRAAIATHRSRRPRPQIRETACRSATRELVVVLIRSMTQESADTRMRQIALLYHDVIGDDSGAGGRPARTSAATSSMRVIFRAHLDKMADLGAAHVGTVSLGEPSDPGRLPVHLTFDDGGVTAHRPTAACSRARGWRGHFFHRHGEGDSAGVPLQRADP